MKAATQNKNKKAIKFRSRNRSLVINLIIVVVIGIFSGFLIGMWFISNKTDPNLYDFTKIPKLYDNVSTIRKESANKTPVQLGATKTCVLAFDNTFNYKSVKVQGTGSYKAMGVNQKVNSYAIRKGDDIFFESVSASKFVKSATRYYPNGEKSILEVKGNVSDNKVFWTGAQSKITYDDYAKKMGGGINEYSSFLVSSKTVVNEGKVTKDGENFKFSLTLHKVDSVLKYVQNMKTTGSLPDYPVFLENVEMTVIVDSNYRLLEVTTKESYHANINSFLGADTSGTFTNVFYYDDNFTVPTLDDATNL